ncbi:MAG: acid phosphatase type 7, partial [Thermomicrobiales bacterium]|nr:acid phosphatase type 7 [Thermomicrobiales bacterium]
MRIRRFAAPAVALVLLVASLAPLASAPPGEAQGEPRLRLRPPSGAPGDRITARGTNFPSDTAGELVWLPEGAPSSDFATDGDGAVLADFTTDGAGSFRARFAVPDVAAGEYLVDARVGDVTVEAWFSVEATGGALATDPPAPTDSPPTEVPPTDVPPTDAPPTNVPPTETPTSTDIPLPTDTATATDVPPTATSKAEPEGPSVAEAPGAGRVVVAAAERLFAPVADARVTSTRADAPRGLGRVLRVDADPLEESYLRFEVVGLGGAASSASLRLWVTDGTADGPAVGTAGNDWAEASVTWINRPAPTGDPVDDKGALAAGTWVAYDVTPFVKGDGTFTFRLTTTTSNGASFASREDADPAHRPQLVVASAIPNPTATPTRPPAPAAEGDCPTTLQALVDAAAPGATVRVPACVYRETVTVTKSVVLDGGGQA